MGTSKKNGILLRALLPDMEPATPENDRRLYGNIEGGWGPRVQILVGPRSNRDLAHVFSVFSHKLDPHGEYPVVFGLKFSAVPNPRFPKEIYSRKAGGAYSDSFSVVSHSRTDILAVLRSSYTTVRS